MEEEGKRQHKCKYLRTHEAKEHNCPAGCKLCEEYRSKNKTKRGKEEEEVPILLSIPNDLCVRLMDDNDKLTNNSYLVPLPRKPSARQVIGSFAKSSNTAEIKTFATSFYRLFCRMVGPYLLYEIEKRQFAQVLDRVKDTDELGDYYGAEHMLRLVALLPKIADKIQFEQMDNLKSFLEEFAVYLSDNEHDVFCPEYFRINPNQKTIE
ncbi:C2H2-type domain-containing protein [Entamoeba marina]